DRREGPRSPSASDAPGKPPSPGRRRRGPPCCRTSNGRGWPRRRLPWDEHLAWRYPQKGVAFCDESPATLPEGCQVCDTEMHPKISQMDADSKEGRSGKKPAEGLVSFVFICVNLRNLRRNPLPSPRTLPSSQAAHRSPCDGVREPAESAWKTL